MSCYETSSPSCLNMRVFVKSCRLEISAHHFGLPLMLRTFKTQDSNRKWWMIEHPAKVRTLKLSGMPFCRSSRQKFLSNGRILILHYGLQVTMLVLASCNPLHRLMCSSNSPKLCRNTRKPKLELLNIRGARHHSNERSYTIIKL